MGGKMNISVNGDSRIPPGFRFHPTEEELLQYYLRKKVANDKIDLDVILEVDLNELEPWDIQERCKIGSTPQNDWYFFGHKDKKYPTGTRTNRATKAGFWKATGRDKAIYSNCERIGMRKTLVFYKGRAPHGQKSDWIMHEYRFHETTTNSNNNNDIIHVTSLRSGDFVQEEGWVVCRIFKKKNHLKALDCSIINPSNTIALETQSPCMLHSPCDHDHPHHDDDQGASEQIFQFIGTKSQNLKNNNIAKLSTKHQVDNRFMKLPFLEMPNNNTTLLMASYYDQNLPQNEVVSIAKTETDPNSVYNSEFGLSGLGDWAAIDKLVATHLNGQSSEENMSSIFSPSSTYHYVHHDHHEHEMEQLPPLRSPSSTSSSSRDKIYHPSVTTLDNYEGNNEIDLWSFTRSSSSSSLGIDPLCHLSEDGI